MREDHEREAEDAKVVRLALRPWMMMAVATIAVFGLSVCLPLPREKEADRAEVRAMVILLTDAVATAYEVCAGAVRLRDHDPVLKARCHKALDPAGDALKAAANGVDAYTFEERGSVGCAAKAALAGLRDMDTAWNELGVVTPPIVTDAIALAARFPAPTSCPVP